MGDNTLSIKFDKIPYRLLNYSNLFGQHKQGSLVFPRG